MFDVRRNRACEKAGDLKTKQLTDIFAEIYQYRETGVLTNESKLEALSSELFGADSRSMLRTAEDAVIFEMARRYANISGTTNDDGDDMVEDYSNLKKGDVLYYADPETGTEVDEGTVSSVEYDADRSDRPRELFVDFLHDFDGFYGEVLGRNMFRSRRKAEIIAGGGTIKSGCACCTGDKAVFWKSDGDSAFVDAGEKEMLVAVGGNDLRIPVRFCPICGKRF